MTSSNDLFVQMALKAWNGQVSLADKFFASVSDEQMLTEIAPGRNRIIYILGHLIAVHDNLIALLGLGDRLYQSYDEPFLKSPDKSGLTLPDVVTLRADWQRSNEILKNYFVNLTAEEWLARHNAMSDEDWQKDPARNKLSVLLSRTNHLAYHFGQLQLVNKPT